MIQWVPRAESRGDAPAIIKDSQSRSYADLLNASERFASALLDGKQDLDGDRVAFLVPSGFDYAAVQQGIWRAGGVAVPLSQSATRLENEYVLGDSQASVVVAAAEDYPR